MKDTAKYAKVVAWSEEDQLYIGYAPGLVLGGCCHGDDEKTVFAELCDIVEEIIQIIHEDGDPLPQPTAGHYNGNDLADALMPIISVPTPA